MDRLAYLEGVMAALEHKDVVVGRHNAEVRTRYMEEENDMDARARLYAVLCHLEQGEHMDG